MEPKVFMRGFQTSDRRRCREILDSLPDWFGLPESNAGYVARLSPIATAVAMSGSQNVGFVSLLRHNPISVEIDVIAVDRQDRGLGIGRLLMGWAEESTRAEGVRWLHVKTRGPSTPDPYYEQTRAFYAHLGYEPLFESLEIWGPEDAALVLVRSLAEPAPRA